jgi:hypothetical protein
MIFDNFLSLRHDHLKQLKELHFLASCLVNDQPPSHLSNDLSKSSRSGSNAEHFNARDVAFREIRAARAFKFKFSLPFFST